MSGSVGSLDGRIAIVSGASAGIGAATVRGLAARGARVIANARRVEKLNALADDVNRQTGDERVRCVAGDAAEDATVGAMLDACGADGPAIVVVNAGRGLAGSVATSDAGEWEEMIRVNILGAARLMRAAGERMTAALSSAEPDAWRDHPRDIVVLGSNVGKHISPFSSMYGATKFGVNSLAEAHRRELGPKGIRVTLVAPGIVRSEFQQVAGYDPDSFGALMDKFGPVLEPEDVARMIAFVVEQPAHVHINDIVMRPTRQDYP